MRYAWTPDLLQEELEGKFVVLHGDERWVVMEGTAAFVWSLLRQPHSVDELVAASTERFTGSPDRIGADVHAVLQDLRERGLLTNVE
jgi:coenzyme PQQ synthesis protein D (PqqD)